MQYVTLRDQCFFRPKAWDSTPNGGAGSLCGAEMGRKCGRPRAEHIKASDAGHADRSVARSDEAELGSGTAGEVEHAAPDERSAIVDAHDDAAAIVLVGDPELGAERQAAVGCGQCGGVHALA